MNVEDILADPNENANKGDGDVEMRTTEETKSEIGNEIVIVDEINSTNNSPDLNITESPPLENTELPTLANKEAVSSLFSCSICKHRVNASSAKILACIHTVCETCVENAGPINEIVCGFCNHETGLDALEKHFLLEDVDERKNENQICQLCSDNLVANHKCIQCDDVMCVDCVFAHKRVKLTKDHQLTELFQVTSVVDLCPIHKTQQLLWHCQTCDEITCPNCQLEAHNGHEYQPAEDGVKKFRNQISQGEENNDKRMKNLADLIQLFNKRIVEVDDSKASMEAALLATTSCLHEAVNRRDSRLRQAINETCQAKRTTYEVGQKRTEELKSMAGHLKLFAETTRRCRNKLYLRRCASLLFDKFNSVEEFKIKLVDSSNFAHEPVKISLKHRKVVENLLKVIEEYGAVKSDDDPNQSTDGTVSRGCSPIMFPPDDEITFLETKRGSTNVGQSINSNQSPLVFQTSSGTYVHPHIVHPMIIPLHPQYHPLIITNVVGNGANSLPTQALSNSVQISNADDSRSTFEKSSSNHIDNRKRKRPSDSEGDHCRYANRLSGGEESFNNEPIRATNGHSMTSVRQKNASNNRNAGNSTPSSIPSLDRQDLELGNDLSSHESSPMLKKKSKTSSSVHEESNAKQMGVTPDQNESTDDESNQPKEWEEFCFICENDSGDLLKCQAPTCTRVCHRSDHVPSYSDDFEFTDDEPFICGLCRNPLKLKTAEDALPKAKRKSDKMTLYEHQVAERILLEMICHESAKTFLKLPDKALPDYYKIIRSPVALETVRQRLETGDRQRYTIEQFIHNVCQIFVNCFTYFESNSEFFNNGHNLGNFFKELIDKYLPDFLVLVDFSKDGERSRDRLRKRRTREFPNEAISDADSY